MKLGKGGFRRIVYMTDIYRYQVEECRIDVLAPCGIII